MNAILRTFIILPALTRPWEILLTIHKSNGMEIPRMPQVICLRWRRSAFFSFGWKISAVFGLWDYANRGFSLIVVLVNICCQCVSNLHMLCRVYLPGRLHIIFGLLVCFLSFYTSCNFIFYHAEIFTTSHIFILTTEVLQIRHHKLILHFSKKKFI